MNYNEFNGLGLLGQSIQYIKETNTEIVQTKYEEFIENRNKMDDSFTKLIEKKKLIPPNSSNSIDTFLVYFLNNVNDSNYNNIKTLEQRISTLDKALIILKNEYTEHYTKFLEHIENPDEYNKIMTSYLYMKSMNEFSERLINMLEELPKVQKPSL